MKVEGDKTKEEIQEVAYKTPYHWFIDRKTSKGRLYFGYLDFCADLAEGMVLDAGCGDGRFLGLLQEKGFDDKNLYGVDISEQAISFAKLLTGLETIKAENLNTYQGSFDSTFLIETLEHIKPEEIDRLLENLSKITKRLVITVPSVNIPVGEKHYQHFTKESLSSYLEKYFEVEKIYGQYLTKFHPMKIFYKLIDNKLYTIHPISVWYNTKIWPKLMNITEPENGGRLIAVCNSK